MNETSKMIACLVLGLAVGVVVGRLWSGEASPEATPTEPVSHQAPEHTPQPPKTAEKASPSDAPSGSGDCEARLAALEKKITALSGQHQDQEDIIEGLEDRLIKSGSASREGTPLEWPEDITPAQDKRRLETLLDQIEAECPGYIGKRLSIECDEYPCTAAAESALPREVWMKEVKGCKPLYSAMINQGAFTGTDVEGPDDQKVSMLIIQAEPPEDAEATRKFLEESRMNRHKRLGVRGSKHFGRRRAAFYKPACEAGDADACATAGSTLNWVGDKEEGARLLNTGCDKGSGRACNSLAWTRCKDQNKCDEEALANARRAAEISPEDGQGALDTLGYILCQMGKTSEAEATFARSCAAGYKKNCNRKCE